MRFLRRIIGILLIATMAIAGLYWWRFGVIEVRSVTPSVYVLRGLGSNVVVLVTDAGVVVIDTMTWPRQGRLIRREIGRLTDQPIAAILNTHYHLDHTHGNPAFAPGTKVVATAQTLEHLKTLDAGFWSDPPARDLLPNETFNADARDPSDNRWELSLGGKTVEAMWMGRGHTDGDLVVRFVEDRVLHTGDLLFNGHWPNIDLEAGGSVRWWPATLDAVLGLDFDVVIPGHGPLATRADLERFRDFMSSLWRQTATIAARGGSLADARAEIDLDEWNMRRMWWFPILSRSSVIGRAYEEARTLLANVGARPSSDD
jgi:cyclase